MLSPWLNEYAADFKASQMEEIKVSPYKVTSVVEIKFTHPWLQRKQLLLKQTTIKKKQWRKDRQDNDIVDINGKKQRWKQFKSKFYEDLDAAIQRGEQVKFQEFVLNQGQPNEKLIIWDDRHGFMSEDSENEQTKFNAF